MRIQTLDLLAFGHFRGHSLDFSAPGIHVVLGRNEAGKSTTLRAITGLLYGIGLKTPDAHVHKMGELRIGGTLASGHEQLRVVRRKGTTSTLLDPDGKPIDEAVLRRLLGGVTEETFVHAYGLDHDTLAEGAKALLEGKGDLGESLFDASVGGGGEVQRLLAELGKAADEIYRPRATSLPLNDALKAFDEAKKQVRERQMLPDAYRTQEEGLATASAERDACLARKKELEQRRQLVARARARGPRERQRAHALEVKVALGAVPMHIARIEELRDRFSVYEQNLAHLRAHRADAERLGDRVAEAMRRAGISGAGKLESHRVDARKEARVNDLLRVRAELTARIEAATVEIARAERALSKLVANPSDPTIRDALAPALERARALGDIESRIANDRAKLEHQTKTLAAKADAHAKLSPIAPTPMSAQGKFSFVAPAPIAKKRKASAGQLALGAAVDSAVGARASRRGAEAKRTHVTGGESDDSPGDRDPTLSSSPALGDRDRLRVVVGRVVPDLAVIDAHLARANELARKVARNEERIIELERDGAGLEKQAAALTGDFAPPAAVDLRAARDARESAWERVRGGDAKANVVLDRAMRDADAIADRMIREADRVTTLARLRNEGEANQAQLVKAQNEAARLSRDGEALEASLDALFEGTAPPNPRGWLEAHTALGEDFERLESTRTGLDLETTKVERAKADLERVLGGDASRTLAELVLLAQRAVNAIDDAGRAVVAATEQTAARDERVSRRDADVAALVELSTKLAELLGPLGLAADATADEVNHSINALRDVFALADKRADVDGQKRAMEAATAEFQGELTRCLRDATPDLPPDELGASARELFDRARRAKETSDLIAQIDTHLADLGPAVVLEDPPADLEAAEHELTERIDELEAAIGRHDKEIGRIGVGLEEMRRGSEKAANAAADAQEHLARVREAAERWARVKLASVILGREIERYREENQGPLLSAASALFRRLTLERYSGIRAGFDDKDRPCLRCVRETGEVDVTGLSDGTRDQLYLSLRLASLLRRAEVAEPMPLVLDDVLIQLDDERAAAALGVLAEVSSKMQVLFFTHHARLVELAKKAVPRDQLNVHMLQASERPDLALSV
jgi:uncharacterized protein YhaN